MSDDTSLDRVEKLLAAILLQSMKSATQREKVIELNLAGFTNVEIADLLETSSQVVATYMSEARKGRKKRSRK